MTQSEAGKLGAIKSRATFQRLLAERIAKYNDKPTKCGNCQKPLDYNHRHNQYCDRSCAAISNNTGIFITQAACLHCGTPVPRKPNIYCCVQCQHDHAWEIAKIKIKKKQKFPSSRVGKRYLLELNVGKGCNICNTTQWLEKPILLVMDHIDGNHENMAVQNCRLICSNCDATLVTYKNRNKGNGRYARRMRYKQNLSY